MATENTWKSILQPVATALVAFLAAATLWLQRDGSEKADARIAALEAHVSALDKRSDQLGMDMDNFRVLLSDIRADVSYVRGVLERRKR